MSRRSIPNLFMRSSTAPVRLGLSTVWAPSYIPTCPCRSHMWRTFRNRALAPHPVSPSAIGTRQPLELVGFLPSRRETASRPRRRLPDQRLREKRRWAAQHAESTNVSPIVGVSNFSQHRCCLRSTFDRCVCLNPNVAINVVCHTAFSLYFKDLMVGIAVLFNLTCGESERRSKIDTRSCEIGDLPTIG